MDQSNEAPEEALVRFLREVAGFTIVENPEYGEYTVMACFGRPMPRQPRLSLPGHLVTAYLAAREAHDPGLPAISLLEVHLQEELDVVGLDGENHTLAVGIRRGSGGVPEFFSEREPEPPFTGYSHPPEDLHWQS